MVTDLERQLNVQSIEFLFVSITILFLLFTLLLQLLSLSLQYCEQHYKTHKHLDYQDSHRALGKENK